MLDNTTRGRHRAAARRDPWTELSTIVRGAGRTSVKASAVLAVSGALVAAFAFPTHATATAHTRADTTTATTTSAPTAAKAIRVLAPAVVAPAAAAPSAVGTTGVVGIRAVAKHRPRTEPRTESGPRAAVPRALAARTQSSSTATATRSATRPVSSSHVRQSTSEVVDIARTLLGIPYVYGGSTPSGFDCSGFTMYVFDQAGIAIPRTASAQQAAATPVSEPRPGDLVFFGSPASHVGIYTGNGMMIDSPRSGRSTSERPVFSGVSGYGRF